MPGFLTHYIGGQSVLGLACPHVREYIRPAAKVYNLGTQGPDIFFYHLTGLITSRVRGVGSQMHDSNLGLFFLHMADYIKNSQSPAGRQIVFAYTAGLLAHYGVDVHTHPYVYARTHNPPGSRIKESARHRHFETSIDVLMLRRMYGKRPGDLQQWRFISPKKVQLRVAAAAMSEGIREIYGRDIGPVDVYHAMAQMGQLTKRLQSKTGRRKRWLQRAEGLVVKAHIISALVHMQEVTDGVDYLNLEKTPWSAPWAVGEARMESFIELFDTAVADAARMTQALYEYINGRLPKHELAGIIMNRSLKTGADGMDNGTISPAPAHVNIP